MNELQNYKLVSKETKTVIFQARTAKEVLEDISDFEQIKFEDFLRGGHSAEQAIPVSHNMVVYTFIGESCYTCTSIYIIKRYII